MNTFFFGLFASLCGLTNALYIPVPVHHDAQVSSRGTGVHTPAIRLVGAFRQQSDNVNNGSLVNFQDTVYAANMTIGGQEVLIQLDTGSSDLWVSPQTGAIEFTNSTDLQADEAYGIGHVSGAVQFANVQLGNNIVPNQAFLNVTNATDFDTIFSNGVRGILGLAFDAGSTVKTTVTQAWGEDSTAGETFLTNIFQQNMTKPFFTMQLGRSGDTSYTTEGAFTIGEYLPDYETVRNMPKLERFPNNGTGSAPRWSTVMSGMTINGEAFQFDPSGVDGTPEGSVVAVLDTGYTYPPIPKNAPVSSSTDSMAVVDTAVSSSSIHLESTPSLYNPHTSHVTHSSRIPSAAANSSSTASSAISVVAAQSHSLPPAPPVVLPPISTGGESIYRTIMNRLTALEGNTTLYARYVEEQTAGIREVLLRMGEDLGRLEGIGKAQAQMYQRSVTEFDRQRKKLEREHRELLAKVNHLTDEVVLEKRLGIIQLCLLLAVLVFMTLTRGSRGEHASAHRTPGSTRHMGVREWGRRTLSFSGDWVARFRSRSPTPKPVARPESKPSEHHEAKVEFPSRSASTQTSSHRPFLSPVPHSPTSPHALPRSATRHLTARPRTPSALRVSTPRAHNAHAHARSSRTPPPSARPQMTRSTSSSAGFGPTIIGAVPKSAKRWARSAHLHEVKSPNRPATAVAAIEGEPRPLDAQRPYMLDAVRESESADIPHAALVSEGVTPAVAVDVFSPKSEVAFSRASTASIGRGKQPRPTLSPLHLSAANDLPRMCVVSGATPASDAEGSEGDVWVDTDVEGSESDSGGLAGMVPSPVEHAAQAA